jgi:AraC-like DNA-binding protein
MRTTAEPITVSATVLQQMFLYLRSLQVDIDAFLRSLGVEPASVTAPDAYILNATYLHIQDAAADYVGDPYFGLHMGEFAEVGSWSILGYLMMNCRTLGEALVKSGRYSRIIGNLIEARAEVLGDTVRLVYFTPPHAPEMSRHCFESALASSVRMMRTVTGQPIHPLAVTFTYPEPASTGEYRRVFGCPVTFGQPDNAMTFALPVAYTPIPLANPALLAEFEHYAEDLLAQLQANEPFTRTVTRLILARLDDEALSIEVVARELAISVRTLQNRLEAEGVLFSDLVRDIRRQLAQKYLRENYTVEQITYLLGFSEPSVFRKAFKKWAGVTPREYRECHFGHARPGAAVPPL